MIEYTRINESIKTEKKAQTNKRLPMIFMWLVALTLDTQARSGIIRQTHRETNHAALSDRLPNLSTSLQMLICLT